MELLKKEIENINLRKKNTRKKVENLIEKKLQNEADEYNGEYNGEYEWLIAYYGGQVDELAWVIQRLQIIEKKINNNIV